MKKKSIYLIIFSLLVSLFIYVFYRTEKTVINQLIITMVPLENFLKLQKLISNSIPLNNFIIYSLPEGLWIFCITVTSKSLFIKIGSGELNLLYGPLIFSIGLEILQLLEITNGKFDFLDIIFSLLFWGIANHYVEDKRSNQNIFAPFTERSFYCCLSYFIVYLSHVWP